MHGGLYVLRTLPDGIDGLMDGERQGVPVGKMPVAGARHHIKGSVDGQRNDRKLQLVGQYKGTFLELSHVPGERTGPFREHDHTQIALFQGLTGGLVGCSYLCRATLIDEDLVRLAAGIAQERNLTQLVFHHPFEVTAQKTVDQEDVKRPLMIGHKDIRLVGFQILTAFNLDGQQAGIKDGAGPPAAGIVAPEVTIADGRADADSNSSQDGGQYEYGQHHDNLIDSV